MKAKHPAYTQIPDTSDCNYWKASPYSATHRMTSFKAIDKELHRSLLLKAREEKPAQPEGKARSFKRAINGPIPIW